MKQDYLWVPLRRRNERIRAFLRAVIIVMIMVCFCLTAYIGIHRFPDTAAGDTHMDGIIFVGLAAMAIGVATLLLEWMLTPPRKSNVANLPPTQKKSHANP